MKAQKFTLLVIDDNDDERFFIQKAFQTLGTKYRVQALESGNEAVACLNGEGKYRDRAKFQFPSNEPGRTAHLGYLPQSPPQARFVKWFSASPRK